MSPISRIPTADLRILHFLIPAPSATSPVDGTSDNTAATASNSAAVISEDSLAVAKLGTHDWRCQLSILEDRHTLRATIIPLPATEANLRALGDCCTLQVLGSNLDSPEGVISLNKPVLLVKKIRSEEIFTRGIEFYLDRDSVFTDSHFAFSLILSTHPIKLLGPPNGAQWTHTLKRSDHDPADRTIDPLVEMLIRFRNHLPSTDVLFKFVSPTTGEVIESIPAHQAILSIYPVFSERMFAARAESNPHLRGRWQQRTRTADGGERVELEMTVDRSDAFERMLGFIYSGLLPHAGFSLVCHSNPRRVIGKEDGKGTSGGKKIDQWKMAFELAREYGLEKSLSARPWMEWHQQGLKKLLTEENVLEVYFGWGHAHASVARDCVEFLVHRPVAPISFFLFQPQHQQQRRQNEGQEPTSTTTATSVGSKTTFENESNSHMLRVVKDRYGDQPGCVEFQDMFVRLKMELYQQQKREHRQ